MDYVFSIMDSLVKSNLDKTGLGLALRETIVAHAFSQAPVLIGSRTENQRESLRDIDSIFLLLDFFLDVHRYDLPQEEIMTP